MRMKMAGVASETPSPPSANVKKHAHPSMNDGSAKNQMITRVMKREEFDVELSSSFVFDSSSNNGR